MLHRDARAVRGLKFRVNHDILAIDPHENQAIGLARFNRGLFRVEDCSELNVGSFKCELDEVVWVSLNQSFGNRIVFGHVDTFG